MKFLCNYCPAEFDQIKHLFEHYESEHKNRGFKRYKIRHLPTGNTGLASAPTPEEACQRIAWNHENCEVKEINADIL